MNYPEYLTLFSGKGKFEVNVRFKNFSGKVINTKMFPDEIFKLIDKDNNEFYSKMYFDEFLFEIYKYQIDPINKKLTIFVRKPK